MYVRQSQTTPLTGGNWESLVTYFPGIAPSTAWAGASSITTLGTVIAGTWHGAAVGITYGGTGLAATPTDGQLLVGKTATNAYVQATLTGTTHQVIVTNGSGSIALSLPQSIDTTSTPTFGGETITPASNGFAFVVENAAGSVAFACETTYSTANSVGGFYCYGGGWGGAVTASLAGGDLALSGVVENISGQTFKLHSNGVGDLMTFDFTNGICYPNRLVLPGSA
jgi:hypothetical protein